MRQGDPIEQTVRVAREAGADEVYLSSDVSRYALERERRLAVECARHRLGLRAFPGVTIAPPGSLVPANGDHYRVFTPYWKAWRATRPRAVAATPRRIEVPSVATGRLPSLARLSARPTSPGRLRGGESVGLARARRWLRASLGTYEDEHDDLAGEGTSRLSPYLHFGCLSALALARAAEGRVGGEAFVRQLCWRDFHHQVTAAFPDLGRLDYRPRKLTWSTHTAVLAAWKDGRTGLPLVDAGMRQLRDEGWMPNRTRMAVAYFLTKGAGIDWRLGAAHFADWLVDADVANNAGNWQWTAGTGNDTRPNRRFNLLRQARRFDPDGTYVRRHVPELRSLEGPAVHTPWRLGTAALERLGYPDLVAPEIVAR